MYISSPLLLPIPTAKKREDNILWCCWNGRKKKRNTPLYFLFSRLAESLFTSQIFFPAKRREKRKGKRWGACGLFPDPYFLVIKRKKEKITPRNKDREGDGSGRRKKEIIYHLGTLLPLPPRRVSVCSLSLRSNPKNPLSPLVWTREKRDIAYLVHTRGRWKGV